ncbi:hypothetical protein BSL82_04950 [Tardibacter chloracetimidivorans]|uniref:Uncharacterized protein n=1 Tax=Tardibacter chloracetimidivorans TaxID=1921510 RepID=A0A1L3ZSX6_9SPHN|nr:hypothetical protein [Tardibacter chloracetimidivorans]API58742.1 hypothetical protein BSL82_04950 [Tardibacter chloracetimidivorans]
MAETIRRRADKIFARCRENVQDDINAILAEHSAVGRLQSGATITRTVRAFETRSAEALGTIFESVTTRTDHRGREWRKMLNDVQEALDAQMDAAPDFLKRTFLVAKKDGPQLAEPLLAAARATLNGILAEFRDGWTSPRPKPWNERHPVIYAIGLLILGAIAGTAVNHLIPL